MRRRSSLLWALLLTGCVTTTGRTTVRTGPEDAVDPIPAEEQRAAGRAALQPGITAYTTRTLPSGLACLIRLSDLGIPHRHLKQTIRGVNTPVRVTGPIAGILYKAMGRHPLVCDCRLALALHRTAPYLRNLGVTEMHFSSAYNYRRMPSGKLSRHAMGLAIDVHRVKVDGQLLTLEEDYELGLGEHEGCLGSSPVLNRIGCVLREKGLFDRVLTPDFDRSHYNHFHLAILSLHRRRFIPKGTPLQADAD
jgi:hypothetical protein